MKLVRFEDGTYGIRKWSLFTLGYVYYDFQADLWWSRRSRWMRDCRVPLELAQDYFNRHMDKGVVVK